VILFWTIYFACAAGMFLYLSITFAMNGMMELKSPAASIRRNIIPIIFGSLVWWWALAKMAWDKLLKRR
jgi:hypothetical protein